jgi:hypothetical protein
MIIVGLKVPPAVDGWFKEAELDTVCEVAAE